VEGSSSKLSLVVTGKTLPDMKVERDVQKIKRSEICGNISARRG
jgi:hypothetical protein